MSLDLDTGDDFARRIGLEIRSRLPGSSVAWDLAANFVEDDHQMEFGLLGSAEDFTDDDVDWAAMLVCRRAGVEFSDLDPDTENDVVEFILWRQVEHALGITYLRD